MTATAFKSTGLTTRPAAPMHLSSPGSYHPPSVLSAAQFSGHASQVRERITIGGLRINVTGHSTRFSVGGAGYRFSSSGRVTHRTTIKD